MIQNSSAPLGLFTNVTLDVRGTSDIHHSFTLNDLEPHTTYEVYISAENAAGEGESTRLLAVTDDTDGKTCINIFIISIIMFWINPRIILHLQV